MDIRLRDEARRLHAPRSEGLSKTKSQRHIYGRPSPKPAIVVSWLLSAKILGPNRPMFAVQFVVPGNTRKRRGPGTSSAKLATRFSIGLISRKPAQAAPQSGFLNAVGPVAEVSSEPLLGRASMGNGLVRRNKPSAKSESRPHPHPHPQQEIPMRSCRWKLPPDANRRNGRNGAPLAIPASYTA
jgi:hypothetical protein